MHLLKLFSIIVLVLLLPACGGQATSAPEPPLPPVVQVTPTPQPPTDPPPSPPTEAAQVQVEPTPTAAATEPAPTEAAPTATDTLPPSPTPLPQTLGLNQLNVQLLPVAGGLNEPVYLTHAGDGSGRLFVVEQPGRILVVQNGRVNPEPFLDITPLVGSGGSEQGLLSVGFHPDFAQNGYLFVNYTDLNGDTVIARYTVSGQPDVADPNSAKILLTIDQPYGNHNGGHVLFGPDGYLYVGMGDGGSGGDPENRAQNLESLLGKILRLDVDNADPYGAPPTNPFVNTANARPEIWSYGWRNPWRMAFDPLTNDLYIADVGQNKYEEVDVEPAGSPGGLNYGWRLMEGLHCYEPAQCQPAQLNVVLPVAEYSHNKGCSITGGYVYRGSAYPALAGVYFYGDFCSGTVWGLRAEADGRWSQAELLSSGAAISSFGQDEAGEVYLVDLKGNIYQLIN